MSTESFWRYVADDADPQREPAPEAELALGLELTVEDERASVDAVVAALHLRDSVHEDLERAHHVGGQTYARSPETVLLARS